MLRPSLILAGICILLPLAGGCFFFGNGGGGDDCDCLENLGICERGECADDCIVTYQWGAPEEIQTFGDCKALVCLGDRNPEEVEDPSDAGDDGNACTAEKCGPDGPFQERLPFGTSCEGDGVCAAEVVCVSCGGEPCWNVDCGVEPPIIEPLEAGTACGADQVCDGGGNCFLCDDGSSCTTEDCSTGVIVVVETLDPGSACETAAGEVGYCSQTGQCLSCDDGDDCTVDTCPGGIEHHDPAPFGTVCGPTDNGICEDGVCITWCTPLPDLETCPDDSPYEPTNDEMTGEPQFLDDDEAPKPICGVLTPGDVDWISYYAEDESLETDINDFQFWSFSKNLRFCAYAECGSPSSTSAPCEDGGVPSMSPTGFPGCCWQGTFNSLDIFSMNLDCFGDNDSGWVRIRIDNPFDEECAPYGLLDYGY